MATRAQRHRNATSPSHSHAAGDPASCQQPARAGRFPPTNVVGTLFRTPLKDTCAYPMPSRPGPKRLSPDRSQVTLLRGRSPTRPQEKRKDNPKAVSQCRGRCGLRRRPRFALRRRPRTQRPEPSIVRGRFRRAVVVAFGRWNRPCIPTSSRSRSSSEPGAAREREGSPARSSPPAGCQCIHRRSPGLSHQASGHAANARAGPRWHLGGSAPKGHRARR